MRSRLVSTNNSKINWQKWKSDVREDVISGVNRLKRQSKAMKKTGSKA